MTREEIEKAIRVLKEWQSYYESLDLDSESPEDDPTSEADSLEAFNLSLALLKRELQFLDAGYKNQKVEFYIGGRKFMVKEMAQ